MPKRSSDLSDRLRSVRDVTIREECSDPRGVPVGIIYKRLGSDIEHYEYANFPTDYVVTMRIRFRNSVQTRDLAASLLDYVKGEIPGAKRLGHLDSNKAVYVIEGGDELNMTIAPADNSSRSHTNFVVRCNYYGAVYEFKNYAEEVIKRKSRVLKPRKGAHS